MNDNSMAIIILCSYLCTGEGIRPYDPSEWTKLAEILMSKKMVPSDLLSFSEDDFKQVLGYGSSEIQRIKALVSRSGSIAFEIEKYSNMGINIVTRADANYPMMLKTILGKSCPPLFYYAGDMGIANKKCVGFVGSRSIDESDSHFAESTVKKVLAHGYSVVTGGAKGIDSVSSAAAINNGGYCVEYIADSMMKTVRNKDKIKAIRNGQLLILSVAKPDAGFNTGMAMMRNKYIYAQSDATVVIRSDYKKGGTWSGAAECLRHQFCPVLCRKKDEYQGNIELIKAGAFPIDESWDGDVSVFKREDDSSSGATDEREYEQMSFFE